MTARPLLCATGLCSVRNDCMRQERRECGAAPAFCDSYMIGKMYEARKKSVGEHQGNQYAKMECFQNEDIPKGRTVEQIANELSVGKSTVERAEKFAKGVDKLKEAVPEAADPLRSKNGRKFKAVLVLYWFLQ